MGLLKLSWVPNQTRQDVLAGILGSHKPTDWSLRRATQGMAQSVMLDTRPITWAIL